MFMKKLNISLLYDNLHFLFGLVILLILTLKYWYFGLVLFFYFVFLYKKTPLFNVGVFLAILVVVSSFQYTFYFVEEKFDGIVIDCTKEKATLLTSKGKVLIYHEDDLKLGDSGIFTISMLNYDNELFNYT